MNTVRSAVKGMAVWMWVLLPMLAMPGHAAEIYNATLEALDPIDVTAGYSIRATVRFGNRTEQLLLNPHDEFNHLNIVDNNGLRIEQTGIAYIGVVEAEPSSTARLYVDGNFVQGSLLSRDSALHFSSDRSDAKRLLKRFRSHEPLRAPGKKLKPAPSSESAEDIIIDPPDRGNESSAAVTRVARIGVVIDSLYQEAIAGRGISKAIATINSVDSIYRENFGLALQIQTVVFIDDNETLSLDESDIKHNLERFKNYRIDSDLLPADLAFVHLFTGIGSIDDSIGLAFVDEACSADGNDVSLSRQFLYPVMLAAHEIGHNLGAEHDSETQACESVDNKLMTTVTSQHTSREFSACSSDAISAHIQNKTCYIPAIDIGLTLTQLESNQILVRVTNLDDVRAIPAATLNFELSNTAIAEAPSSCEILESLNLLCTVPATFAAESQDFQIKLRFEPNKERVIAINLETDGYIDLNQTNNSAEIRIPGAPVSLASTNGSITQNNQTGGSGGGGIGKDKLAFLIVCLAAQSRRRVKQHDAKQHTAKI